MDPETSATEITLDETAYSFVKIRPRLIGIAYRLLGSTAEAEDVVQEVWLRWQKTDRSIVVSPQAFLITATTRLAINVAQSARIRRETYIGPWLPEPIDTGSNVEADTERTEDLAFALLLVMERLNPTERAAYVLREAFDYSYRELAEILQVSVVNARQIVNRARKRLSTERRETVNTAAHRQLVASFIAATQTGDVASLKALLASDALPANELPPPLISCG